MKLRNKKTGKVQTCDFMAISDDSSRDGEIASLNSHVFIFRSIEQLNEGYEDYKPKEPLIKDEKIRKAVRAWAEACGVNRVVHGEYDNELCAKGQQFYGAKIVLTKTVALPRGRNYTIAELCGEEEE